MSTPGLVRRAVLYGRVSKLVRGRRSRADPLLRPEGKSVDQQLDEMIRQAEREGVTIIGPYRDDGISASRFGKSKARGGWEQTMEAIVSGDATELWTWEISRATRDRPVWAALINACITRNVQIGVNGRLHDPLDPDDGFMLDLQAALAVRESAVTSKRIRRDVAARATQGKPHGKIPYGYTRTYDPKTRELLAQVPDPETAPVLAEIARRVLAGESIYAVAADLDEREIPSPEVVRARRVYGEERRTEWRCETIRSLLLSPTAAGQRTHRGLVVAVADWKPIISAAQHVALVAMLSGKPARRNFQPGVVQHLLSGVALCGVCGTPLRRVLNRSSPSYTCPGPRRRGDSCVARLQRPLDAMVTLHVVRRLADPGLLESFARAREGADQRVDAATTELADLRAQLASFVEAAMRKEISAASFGQIEKGLQSRIDEADERLKRSAPVPAAVLGLAGPDAQQRWDKISGDLPRQRAAIRALLRVVVNRSTRPRGSRGFDEASVDITAVR